MFTHETQVYAEGSLLMPYLGGRSGDDRVLALAGPTRTAVLRGGRGGGGGRGGEGEVISTARYAKQRERETGARGRAYRNILARRTDSNGRDRRGGLRVPEETGEEGGAYRERPAWWAALKERPAQRVESTGRDLHGGLHGGREPSANLPVSMLYLFQTHTAQI